MARINIRLILLFALIAVVSPVGLLAQRFSVESFRVLPNDVTAFINPVRDLNDEDCGLIKVMASPDFVFSTPLGIVRREDHTGEIWLYVPKGTKKITLKHAELGVLRDYQLSSRIDSHLTYELRVKEPERAVRLAEAEPVITTLTDTVVVTRVDTLVVRAPRRHYPLRFLPMVTASFGGRSPAALGGMKLMLLRRHGGFIHAATDFGHVGRTIGECDRYGRLPDGSTPFYSGHTRRSAFMVNAGAVHRLSDRVDIYEGLGYGSTSLAWELAPSEGGGYLRNKYYTTHSVAFEVGAVLSFDRIVVSLSAISIRGVEWFGSVGIGLRIGK